MGLFNKVTELRMKDPVEGTLTIVGITSPDPTATANNYRLDGVIVADGLEATSVTHHGMTSVSKWPYPGQVLPVTVDRKNPKVFVVHWEDIPTGNDSAKAQADALAASMRASNTAPSGGYTALPATPGAPVTPEIAALLAQLGLPNDGSVTVTSETTVVPSPVEEPKRISAADILAHGVAGSATVLGSFPDGTPAPDPDSVMRGLMLNVMVDGRAPFQVTNLYRVPLTKVDLLKVGLLVPVKVDVGNQMMVAVDWDGVS
jgi:hypothetical protein